MNKYQKAVHKVVKTDINCGVSKRLGLSMNDYRFAKKQNLKQIRKHKLTVSDILLFNRSMKTDYHQQRLDFLFYSGGIM